MSTVGIILCGGASRRMGRDKASLMLNRRTLLEHIAETMSPCVESILICAAPSQILPPISISHLRLDDETPGSGPLPALAGGLAMASQQGHELAFVQAVDMPFVTPEIITFFTRQLRSEVDAVVPIFENHRQPLCAAYRTSTSTVAADLVSRGERSIQTFLDALHLQIVNEEMMMKLDPQRVAFRNINTPADYETFTK